MITEFAARVRVMHKKKEFQSSLKRLVETPDGKVFFEQFLRDCGVTRPKIARDPQEIAWNESKRHLAVSYLNILARNDMDHLVLRMEEELQRSEQESD